MKEKEKQAYLRKYKEAKEKGVPFYPDAVFKDAVVSLVIFTALVGLAYFVGAPLEARANPADTNYTPRPEWYFMFLFQLLKYFPGELEFIGVVVIPTVAIILLFFLPFLDRSSKRHFSKRPVLTSVTAVVFIGIVLLSVQAVRETPPPVEVVFGDQTAALYTANCAPCHGATLLVPPGTNLHAVIAQGKHEDMPAWSADLSTDQIDALAGFVLSPGGSDLFSAFCGECHEVPELVSSNPLELKAAFEEGQAYPAHLGIELNDFAAEISAAERTEILNFLIAPDGQRLFAINCSTCHGSSVAFAGEEETLRTIIRQGGLHLEMPPWREELTDQELDTLATYVIDPDGDSNGESLFKPYCAPCHGVRLPSSESFEQARQIIASGGAHETMPVWGEVLTNEQIDALVSYSIEAAQGTSLEVGRELFAQNCALCHGDFGEGGANPARPGDIIAPISSTEYLKTRDDFTLRAIIAQGQPNFGMSPFGSLFGGPLDDEDVDAIVSYMRSWEENPPVELPPEISESSTVLSGVDIYSTLCAQCHGSNGEGLLGPALNDPQFQTTNTDQDIFDTINLGHAATSMISWGEILTSDQINDLVDYLRKFSLDENGSTGGQPSFANDVMPIFEAQCTLCHGTLGGWDGSTYDAVMTTGNNAPVVISGDVENSLLALKISGTQTEGAIMPPGGLMTNAEIQIVLDWIANGAMDD